MTGDIITTNFGLQLTVDNRFSSNFPGFMLIPNEYFGFNIIIPYAYTTTISFLNNIFEINHSFEGISSKIKITLTRINDLGSFTSLVKKFTTEAFNSNTVKKIIIDRVEKALTELSLDFSTISYYNTGEGMNQIIRIPELNMEISNI